MPERARHISHCDGKNSYMNKSETAVACPWSELDAVGSGLSVHDFLTTRVSGLMSNLKREITTAYANQFGLTLAEWRVLSVIAESGILNFGDLVTLSATDKGQLSRTIRELESRNLIEIKPGSKNSKRRIACSITKEGEALHARVIPVARQRQAEVINILSTDEKVALFSIINKLQSSLVK